MIRNIVFDMGQVLIHWEAQRFMELLEVPVEDREQMLREVFRETEWVRLDRGSITEEEAVESMCRRLPSRLHPYVRAMVFDWWKLPMIPMEGMAELITELKELGYKIYLLSNANIHLPEYFDRIPGSEYFDGKLVSAQHRQIKPEREIYQTLFREFSLLPQECFFVDDIPQNIEAARFAGMAGTVFHGDVVRLRRDLNAAGVPVS